MFGFENVPFFRDYNSYRRKITRWNAGQWKEVFIYAEIFWKGEMFDRAVDLLYFEGQK